ncbi:MAG: thioredoxin [Acidobacteriota bacterium]|nr:thioredoxin [Acidobacteriota bacterium]
MAVVTCQNCGAKNRVDERAAAAGRRPVCGRCGAELGAAGESVGGGKPLAVTDATFGRDVLEASRARPVLLDCWAAWCGPCRMIAPVMDELAAESAGRYTVAKLDVDENPRTAAQFGVRSIPTLFIFKDGQLVDRLMGAQPKSVIAARLAAHT